MPRFFAEIRGFPVAVIKEDKDVHHITGPLRKRKGDEIAIRDASKGYRALISSIGQEGMVLEIIREEELKDRGSAKVHLAMCLFDMKAMEDAILSAIELGVASIHPIISERSNVRSLTEARVKRWQVLIHEALKQCERKTPPILHRAEPIEGFINGPSRLWGMRLLALNGAEHSIIEQRAHDVGILIGPEGGFSSREVSMATSEGFIPVSLGNTTLRAFTAIVAALAILGLEA